MGNVIEIHAEQGSCRCGCGDTPSTGRTFRPGHDQRLMGVLARAERAGDTVKFYEQPENVYELAPLAFGQMVFSGEGVAKLQRHFAQPARKSRAKRFEQDPERNQGEPGTYEQVKAAQALPETVKVGRWEYPIISVERDGNGRIDTVVYRNARNEEMRTRQFTIVR